MCAGRTLLSTPEAGLRRRRWPAPMKQPDDGSFKVEGPEEPTRCENGPRIQWRRTLKVPILGTTRRFKSAMFIWIVST